MKILIFGGTGSLGSRLVEFLYKDHEIVVCSRDEQKHFIMRNYYKEHPSLKFVIGDISDKNFVDSIVCLYKPTLVINCAAQKHVRLSDENVFRCVQTNIIGVHNTILACISNRIPYYLFISTDKAVEPTTIYGMTKAIAERLIVNYSRLHTDTKFMCTRYGNVLNSKGSLITLYQSISLLDADHRVYTVTNPDMTRFFLTFQHAVNLILFVLDVNGCDIGSVNYVKPDIHSIDSEIIYIPEVKSARIVDIANLYVKHYDGKINIIGSFFGEKIHELMCACYSSGDNLMSQQELEKFLIEEGVL